MLENSNISYDVFCENVIMTKDDLYKDFDKFESGRSNILLVTGLTGSGKSTLGKQMCSKYNAEYIELDMMDPNSNLCKQGLDVIKDCAEVFYDFFKSHKALYDKVVEDKLSHKEVTLMMDSIIKYCFSWCSKHKDKKFVIEGIQLYDYFTYYNLKPRYPIIIKGTSVVTSFLRKIKREKWNAKGLLTSAPECLKMMVRDDKQLKKLAESITESADNLFIEATKSTLDKDYKSKGKKKLSSFKQIHITEEVINRYKKEYPSLKHVRCKDTKEYICDGYLWMNGNELVATVGSCTYRDDKTKWVVSLEVIPKYRGYGLSEQILDYAVKTMKCTYLSVNKNNEIAKKVYDKYGFKVYKESNSMYYMILNKNINERRSYKMERQNGYVDKRLAIFESFADGSITEAERDDLLDTLDVAYEYGGNRAMLDAMRATRKRMVACRERKEEITDKIKQLEGDLNAVDDDRKDEIKEQIAKLKEEYDEVDKKHHQLADSVKFESTEKGWARPSVDDEVVTESFGALLAGISGAIIAGKAVVKLAKKVEDKSTKKTEDDKPKKPVKIDTSSIDKGIKELEEYHEVISNIEKKGGNPTNVIVDASLILDEIAKKQREIYDATEAGTPERDVAKEVGKRIEAVAAKLKICTSKGTTAEVKTEGVFSEFFKEVNEVKSPEQLKKEKEDEERKKAEAIKIKAPDNMTKDKADDIFSKMMSKNYAKESSDDIFSALENAINNMDVYQEAKIVSKDKYYQKTDLSFKGIAISVDAERGNEEELAQLDIDIKALPAADKYIAKAFTDLLKYAKEWDVKAKTAAELQSIAKLDNVTYKRYMSKDRTGLFTIWYNSTQSTKSEKFFDHHSFLITLDVKDGKIVDSDSGLQG